jgi:acyl-CoA reductase-like NAD-dependent aldehyde dehydrogenase
MIYQLNMNRGETTRAMGFWVNTILILLTSFGGVKESGFGRENHKMALDHYRVVKTG